MEHDRFAEITKQFTATPFRRTLIRGLIAGAVGGALGALRLRDASAACCTGLGAVFGSSRGGNSTVCCPSTHVCVVRKGRKLQCGPFQVAEGGKAKCCLVTDVACQTTFANYPSPPAGCVVVP
jgi:hypothetical protein